ncbi:MAG: 2-oxo acid dehydrogenase subunit E2, partial [Arenimonas sp.]|nr:2-oxo acid dehydrogenase subunit E2 [Arenimonas sp.]
MSDIIEARVPDLGSDSGVPVIELLVKVGDTVRKDQGLLTLESDKATMEVPSPVAGEILEIIAKLGDELSNGDLVARIQVSAGASAAVPPAVPTAPPPVPAPTPMAAPVAVPAVAAPVLPKSPTHAIESSDLVPGAVPYASPAVRVFARELGVDLNLVTGTERGGRIIKNDIQQFVKAALAGTSTDSVAGSAALAGGGLNLIPWPQVDFSKFGPVSSEPLSRIKKLSGANLARNWAMIPHVTQFDEADITEMEIFRKKLGDEHKDVKITPLVFLIKASVAALKKFPAFNASLDGDNLVLKQYVHI